MKNNELFITSWCPFCKKVLSYLDEIKNEYPDFKDIRIKVIDEEIEVDYASSKDYYLVPTFYIDGVKIHEGKMSKEMLLNILKQAQ